MDRELMMSVVTAGPKLVAPTNPGTVVSHRHELTEWSQMVRNRLFEALTQSFDWDGEKRDLDVEVTFLGVHTSGVNMFRFDAFELPPEKEEDEWASCDCDVCR